MAVIAGAGVDGGCSSSSASSSADGGSGAISPTNPATSGEGYSSSGSSSSGGSSGSGSIFGRGGPVMSIEDASACIGNACNGLVITDAPVIEETLASGSPPTFSGGTLADGTYYLTSFALYGGDAGESGESDGGGTDGGGIGTGNSVEEVISVSAGGMMIQIGYADGSGCTQGSVRASTSSNMMTMTSYCGAPFGGIGGGVMTWPYTATPTSITASVPMGSQTAVLTLTVQ